MKHLRRRIKELRSSYLVKEGLVADGIKEAVLHMENEIQKDKEEHSASIKRLEHVNDVLMAELSKHKKIILEFKRRSKSNLSLLEKIEREIK